jgi:hypothetical protein
LDGVAEAMKEPGLLRLLSIWRNVLASAGASFLLVGCQPPQPHFDGSAIDVRFTGADSIAEIREQFSAVIAHTHRYDKPSDGFCIYQVTNGPAEFAFIQVGNWPRGFGAFNLYCYERVASSNWVLRGLAPVNDYYHTNDTSMTVNFASEGEYVKAIHRGDVVFTVTCRGKQSGLK